MSTASVEQFQNDPASLLATVEHGEPVLIERGDKPVARLVPVEEVQSVSSEREEWFQFAAQNLSRAYATDEPEYTPEMIVEPNPLYKP